MSTTQVQLRRGTQVECDAFVGALAELVVDTTNHELRLHDGTKVGGYSIGSGGGIGDFGVVVNVVDELPDSADEGAIVAFNDILYIFKNGQWEKLIPTNVGIRTVYTLPETGEEGQIVFWSSTTIGGNKLYRWTNGVWVPVAMTIDTTEEVADGSINVAKFAQGITPLEIVTTLPTTGNFEGRFVYLTTDDKLYRYNGTAFTTAITANDITGTITSTQIGANQIVTGHLQTDSITSDKIAASSITAGKIAAAAISATEIAAGAISTTKLAAGAITSDKIAANAITGTLIAAGTITAEKLSADALTAGTIMAGSITSDKLATNSITSDKIAANAITAAKIDSGTITSDKIAVTDLRSISNNTGSLIVTNSSGTGQILAGNASVSGTTMLGAGAIIKQNGNFAFGNTGTNISFNGSQMALNGNIVDNSNVIYNSITKGVSGRHNVAYGNGNYQTLLALSTTLASTTRVLVHYNAYQGYTAGIRTTGVKVYQGANVIFDTGVITAAFAPYIAITTDIIGISGITTFSISWYGQDNTVGINHGFLTLSIFNNG